MKKGFTLLELLVVVLIIGILASIALPQYRIAVKKAQLADYVQMVKSLRDAEEIYALEHGRYTNDLTQLNITLPDTSCHLVQDSWCSVYECGDTWYGVCNNATNAQAGTKDFTTRKLRYLHVMQDFTYGGTTLHRGDIVCMAIGDLERKVCQAFAPSQKIRDSGNEAWYLYDKTI